MKIVSVRQGTPEWLEHRKTVLNASEAPAMMGVSPYLRRSELVKQKATGIVPEPDEQTQKLYDEGHRAERALRPEIERVLGRRLYPVTAVDDEGRLGASLDGRTMTGELTWEHKLYNASKAEAIEVGGCAPESDFWQLVHHLRVSECRAVLYTLSRGTLHGAVHLWVLPPGDDVPDFVSLLEAPIHRIDPEDLAKLEGGWQQLERDVEEWEAPEAEEPVEVVRGAKMENLPALEVMVSTPSVRSNIEQYRTHALDVISNISTDLQTDQDFADAKEAIKFCEDVEQRVKQAKESAIKQAEPIETLFAALDEIFEAARQKRLPLEKLTKSRVEEIKQDLQAQAEQKLVERYNVARTRMAHGIEPNLNRIAFRQRVAEAMKGKRTIDSFREAAENVLAEASRELEDQTSTILGNIEHLEKTAGDKLTLFPDIRTLALRDGEYFRAEVELRVMKAEKEAEQAEQARRQAELEAEARAAARVEEESRAQAQEPPTAPTGSPAPSAPTSTPPQAETAPPAAPDAAPPVLERQEWVDADPLSMAEINKLIAPLSITAAGLEQMGITPAKVKGAAKRFTVGDVHRALCNLSRLIHQARESLEAAPGESS